MASTDRDALVAVYNATDGANWTNNGNWNIGDDLSQWYGIEVNDDGRVVELRLGSNNLRGPIPEALGDLSKMVVLDLSGNELTGLGGTEDALRLVERVGAGLLLGNNPWTMPPEAVVAAGLLAVKGYLLDVQQAKKVGADVTSRRLLKLVLVGSASAGKTSLMQSIMARRGSPTKGTAAQASTVGIELHPYQLQDTEVEFFDCAGQVDYAGMHQAFLTRRALYLLVVDITKYHDVDDLDEAIHGDVMRWLYYLYLRAPGSTVILVANKCDGSIDDFAESTERAQKRVSELLNVWHEARGLRGWRKGRVSDLTLLPGMSRVSCDGKGSPEASGLSALIALISHQAVVSMLVPPTWDLALKVFDALRDGREPKQVARNYLQLDASAAVDREGIAGATFLTKNELFGRWIDVVESVRGELQATGRAAAVSNANSDFESALWISDFLGHTLRIDGGNGIFFDMGWLTRVLKPLLSHRLHAEPIGVELMSMRDDLVANGVLRWQFARHIWRDFIDHAALRSNEEVVAAALLGVLVRLGVAIPLARTPLLIDTGFATPAARGDSSDPPDMLVIMRLNETSDSVQDGLDAWVSDMKHNNEGQELTLKWRFSAAGPPPGLVESVVALCHVVGIIKTGLCWRYGAVFESHAMAVGSGFDRLFTFCIRHDQEFGAERRMLTVRMFGSVEDDGVLAALRWVASAVVNVSREWPGLLWEGWPECAEHPMERTYFNPQARVGSPLLGSAVVECDCQNVDGSVLRVLLDRLGVVVDTSIGAWSSRSEGQDKVRGRGWNNKGQQFAKEARSGVDRLGYDAYAKALAGLFTTGDMDVLPTAVGIYATWGSGKSFLLDHLKDRLQESQRSEASPRPTLFGTWCCCLAGVLRMMSHSVVLIIIRAACKVALWWLRSCGEACSQSTAAIPKALVSCFCGTCSLQESQESRDAEAGRVDGSKCGREFVVIEFNAWECAGLEVLWAVVTTKIFDAVEGHTGFGRGTVRAARISKLLEDPSWNWCGLVTFYFIIACVGIVVVLLLNSTDAMNDVTEAVTGVQWAVATLILPGGLTLLNILAQMRSRGSLRTAQSALRKAISKKESVGDAYRGFMSEVKEELETLFDMINAYNSEVEREMVKEDNEKEGEGDARIGETKHKEGLRGVKKTLALAVIVDDLDRCSKEKVVEMLKATHLLLEQPAAPMAVFLAVDPQLIVSAVAESLEGAPNQMKALQYLEKIIHLPFCIPPIATTERLDLLDSLLNGVDNSCPMTLKRMREFLEECAPTKKQWRSCAKSVEKHTSQNALQLLATVDGRACELVCSLEWWRGNRSIMPNWSDKHEASLNIFYVGFNQKRSSVETSPAYVKLLETLNSTINALMSNDSEASSQASQADSAQEFGSEGSAPAAPDEWGDAPATQPTQPPPRAPVATVSGSEVGDAEVRNAPLVPVADAVGEVPSTQEEESASGSRSTIQMFDRAISKGENKMFRTLFNNAKATPRKIKRVVNVYFLQRSLAKDTPSWIADPAVRAKELVTWTTLAEFWPFRMSCIAFAMTNEAPMGKPRNFADTCTIASAYNGSAGDPSNAICKWIDNYRSVGEAKDLFLTDDTEGRFLSAIRLGAQITKKEVRDCFLHISINLNPSIMSTIELEMVYDVAVRRASSGDHGAAAAAGD